MSTKALLQARSYASHMLSSRQVPWLESGASISSLTVIHSSTQPRQQTYSWATSQEAMTQRSSKTVMIITAPLTITLRKSSRYQSPNTLTTLSISQLRVRYLRERLRWHQKKALLQSQLELIKRKVVPIAQRILTSGASAEAEASWARFAKSSSSHLSDPTQVSSQFSHL